jgi:hypothetical protein
VDSVRRYPFVDEILVWNNNPKAKLTLRGDKVRVIDSPQNMMCYGRFLCAKEAKNEIIYVQDDDVIVENIPALYRGFLADSSRITHALSERHLRHRERYVYAGGQVALLGWGAFFCRDWLNVLEPCVEAYGVDTLFRREADKFFSLLLNRRHNTMPARIRGLADERAPDIALYRQDRHKLMKALAVRRALALSRKSNNVRIPVTWNVVVTCRNYGEYLTEAVNSVLLNDADYVVSIVDDASVDETPEIGKRFSRDYAHVSYVRHDQNVGVSRARDSGVAAVDSAFVAFLDADDRIGSNYLFEAEKLLRSGCDVANPDAILFGDRTARWRVPDETVLPMLLQRNSVHYCAAFRRCYWAQAGGMDSSMDYWQDYEFWIRVAEAGARIRRLPGDHFYYRKHGVSKSGHAAKIRDSLRAYIRQKHRELYSRYQ